jgi:hypothetical protein
VSGQRTNTRLDHELRDAFFEEGKLLDAAGDPEANCWLCGERIDYVAAPNTTPDSHNLDHYLTVSEHPELQSDPDNFRHSHSLCNQQRGNGAPAADLGNVMPDWW